MGNANPIAGWAVTPGQIKEFFNQIDKGIINRQNLQAFLDGKNIVEKPVAKNALTDIVFSSQYEKHVNDLLGE